MVGVSYETNWYPKFPPRSGTAPNQRLSGVSLTPEKTSQNGGPRLALAWVKNIVSFVQFPFKMKIKIVFKEALLSKG